MYYSISLCTTTSLLYRYIYFVIVFILVYRFLIIIFGQSTRVTNSIKVKANYSLFKAIEVHLFLNSYNHNSTAISSCNVSGVLTLSI